MKIRHESATLSALLHVAWSLWPNTTSAAETAPVRFYLEYQAPPSCADEVTWLRELERRSSRVVLARDGRPAPSLRVTLTEDEEGVQAELIAIDIDGRETHRMLRASTCDEAVQGSAWVSALWLDPSASGPPAAAEAVSPEEPLSRTSSEETKSPPPTPAVGAALDRSPRAKPSTSVLPMQVGASAQVGDFFTALPDLQFGYGGFLELSAWRGSVVAPLLRVGYVSAGSGLGSTTRGDARVSLATMRTVGCVLAWPRELPFRLQPCAVWELGRLRGSGEDTTASSTANVIWHSLGAVGRATLEIFPLVSIDAEAGAIIPLKRDRFVFGPAPVVSGYATPALAATFSLGFTVGARLGGQQVVDP